jgi:chorismate synthase
MAGSSFGTLYRLSTFGESHGVALGGVIDGVPAGFLIDFDAIQNELARRKPGQSALVTQRKEDDEVEFLSGIYEGKTTGTPIGFIIRNTHQRSGDYDRLKEVFRPSHADFTYQEKYGIRDPRGGGRSSARETACRVVAGALAKQILNTSGIEIDAFVDQVGSIQWKGEWNESLRTVREENPVRVPDAVIAAEMEALIREVRKAGDTIGGCVRCIVTGVPIGLGEPVFDKLHAELGKAMLSINAVKAFSIGSGFDGVSMRGSEHNDIIRADKTTETNYSGGIQGGISNGMPIDFRVAFKPVATIMTDQTTIDMKGEEAIVRGEGRHDPCVVPRAVPIVEAMAAMVLLDAMFIQKSRVYAS